MWRVRKSTGLPFWARAVHESMSDHSGHPALAFIASLEIPEDITAHSGGAQKGSPSKYLEGHFKRVLTMVF
jgi:hypothetical protein